MALLSPGQLSQVQDLMAIALGDGNTGAIDHLADILSRHWEAKEDMEEVDRHKEKARLLQLETVKREKELERQAQEEAEVRALPGYGMF